jgi:RNA polymerase sigma-70 factor (ECF subfamily)
LLQRVSEGDAKAVAACIDRFGGLVWSLARKLIGNASDAEDAVKDVFISIWKNASRYKSSVASEATFVTMIARRRLIDRLRKKQRRVNGDAVDVDDVSVSSDTHDDRSLELDGEVDRVTSAMGELRPEQRRVLSLAVCRG